MELQFHKTGIACLKTVKWDVQTQEQTQEVKLPEGLPDIGRVLGAWGQPVLRGKRWQSEDVGVSCGAMVWVLYAPEDGGPVRTVETWIPMELSWQIPPSKQDGKLVANCLLRSADARMTSARRLMVRANMAVQVQAYEQDQMDIYQPDALPEDIQVLKKTHTVLLPMESGEKAFQLDEELALPDSCPKPQSFLRFCLQPEIGDKKVMSGKVVFRGTALVHTLYESENGELCCWDFEVPFSQYTDLDGDYSEQATAQICPQVTSLETETDEEGRIRLKAGITCQFTAYDNRMVELVEDAFSPIRKVEPQVQSLVLPAVQNLEDQQVLLSHTVPAQATNVVDSAVYVDQVRRQVLPEQVHLQVPAMAQMLYYDADGSLQYSTARWEDGLSMDEKKNTDLEVCIWPMGRPETHMEENGVQAQQNVWLHTLETSTMPLPMVTALELGQAGAKDPNRPSVVLRRVDKDGVWKIAKQTGSSLEAIFTANGLKEEPQAGQMLLIPIL